MPLPLAQPPEIGFPPATAPLPATPFRPDACLTPDPLPDHILPPNALTDHDSLFSGPVEPQLAFPPSVPNAFSEVPEDKLSMLQPVYSAPGTVSVGVIPGPSPTRVGEPFEDGFSCSVLPDKPTRTYPEQPQQLDLDKNTHLPSNPKKTGPRGRPRKAPEPKGPPRPVGRPRKSPQEPKGPPRPVGRPRGSTRAPEPRPLGSAGNPHKSAPTIISSASELSSPGTDWEHDDDLVRSALGAAHTVSSSSSECDEAQTRSPVSDVPTKYRSKVEPSAGDKNEDDYVAARLAVGEPSMLNQSTEKITKAKSLVGHLSEPTRLETHPQLPFLPNAETPIRSFASSPTHSDGLSSAPAAQVGWLAPHLHQPASVPVAYPVIGNRFETLEAFKQACWFPSWAAGHDMRFSATNIFACRHHSSPTNCPFKIVVCKLPTKVWQVVEVEMEHRNHSFKPGDIDPTRTRGWRSLSDKTAPPRQTPPVAARPRRSLGSLPPPALKQTRLSEHFGDPSNISDLKRKLSSSTSTGGGDGASNAESSGSSKRTRYLELSQESIHNQLDIKPSGFQV